MKINVYEAEQETGQRKVNRSFIVHLLMSFSDEGIINIGREEAEKITMLIENYYEYEFYVEYLPHKGIVEFLEDFDLL